MQTNQTPKWLDLFITAFGTQGLIALAWWAGAFHAQRIRELQATYPILQITGGAGVGKSTLVANLWKLAGSSEGDENLYADTCSMGALLAILVRTVNRPVVLEESGRGDERFDWSALRECYTGGAIVRHIGTDAIEGARFGGALAYVGGETEVLNSRIVNIHLPLQRRTAEGRDAIEALHELQIADMANFVETIKANREQLAYRLGGVGRYIDSLQEDTEQRLPAGIDRNHAQLLALLDLLLDLFQVPAEAIHLAHSEVWNMAWQHVPGKTDFAVFKVEPGSTN